MEKGGVSSMDASVQDVWDWEVLPDGHRSFYAESRAAPTSHGHSGGDVLLAVPDQKIEEPILPPPSEAADECKDIGVDVAPAETQEEHTPMPPASTAAELLVSDSDDVVDKFQSSDDAKEVVDDVKPVSVPEGAIAADVPHELAEEEEETKKEKRAGPECLVFSVGKLRVNGIGALCSFGVAAATVCVFLVGGKLQHQQKQQHQQNIQLQFLGDDKRIQQVVQQTSRLNQAVSSMMGAGASTRAKISFGGFYDGF